MDRSRLPCDQGPGPVRGGVGSLLSHPAAGAACRLVLGGVFVYAAVAELFAPAELARAILGYRLVHPDLVNLVAITLPWIAFAAAAMVILGVWPQSAALVLAGLLAVFLGAGFLAVARGMEINCGCAIPLLGSERLDWRFFVRDGVLLAMALQVVVWPSSFVQGGGRGERG